MQYLTRRIAKIGFVAKMVELTKEYVHWMNVGKQYVTSNCNKIQIHFVIYRKYNAMDLVPVMSQNQNQSQSQSLQVR